VDDLRDRETKTQKNILHGSTAEITLALWPLWPVIIGLHTGENACTYVESACGCSRL